MPVYTLAQYAAPALTGAKIMCFVVILMPRPAGQRVPWGPIAVAAWLSALAQLVLLSDASGFWLGLHTFTAAADTAWGAVSYRLWQRDDDDRPRRRRRRVWRLAKAVPNA